MSNNINKIGVYIQNAAQLMQQAQNPMSNFKTELTSVLQKYQSIAASDPNFQKVLYSMMDSVAQIPDAGQATTQKLFGDNTLQGVGKDLGQAYDDVSTGVGNAVNSVKNFFNPQAPNQTNQNPPAAQPQSTPVPTNSQSPMTNQPAFQPPPQTPQPTQTAGVKNGRDDKKSIKINSNTILIKKGSLEYKNIENVLTKIALEHDIENVKEISLRIDSDKSITTFEIIK